MTITYKCPSCNCPIEYDFTPARPAPCCSNHDSPAFSDPGDAAEVDGPEECPECHESIDHEQVIEFTSEIERDEPEQ